MTAAEMTDLLRRGDPVPIDVRSREDLYERDAFAWMEAQIALLRLRRFDALDVVHLIEELESLAARDRREIRSRLTVLLTHLLKYEYQPNGRGNSWRASIREQSRQLGQALRQSPSLLAVFAQALSPAYADARIDAADETGLPLATFPTLATNALLEAVAEAVMSGTFSFGEPP